MTYSSFLERGLYEYLSITQTLMILIIINVWFVLLSIGKNVEVLASYVISI